MQTITKEVNTSVVTITPAMASSIWEEHQRRLASGQTKQRSLSASRAERYASDMRSGAWAVTHQGIAFDTDGNLVDGQHRIYAVILADIPVQFMITTGMPKHCGRFTLMDLIDGGYPRTSAHKLQIGEMKNANITAASVNAIIASIKGSNNGVTHPQLLDVLHIFKTQVELTISMTQARPPLRKGYLIGPFSLALYVCREIAESAIYSLVSLDGLDQLPQVKAFNKVLESGQMTQRTGASVNAVTAFKYTTALMYSIHTKNPVIILRPSSTADEWFRKRKPEVFTRVMEIVNR